MLTAQNGVTVSGLAISTGTVTFNVSWNKSTMPVALWSDTVWVFVDYNNAGKMERLPLLPGATLTATSPGGKVIEEPDNNKGVWVAGNARSAGSFSATVKLLTAIKDVGGACVYGSNYPPVGEYISATKISFTGTPMYKIVLEKIADGSTLVAYSDGSYTIQSGYTVQSFMDKTGALGIITGEIPSIPGIYQPQGSCTYTEPAMVGTFASFNPNNIGAATYVSLVDGRDNKIYPVLKMGGRWMMARNLNYQTGLTFNANTNQAKGVTFTVASSGTPAIGSYWCPGSGTSSSSATCDVYGALYTWETAMVLDGVGTWVTSDDKYTSLASAGTYNYGRATANGVGGSGRGICPPNWHVPTDAEWGLFFDAVEGSGSAHSTVSGNAWVGTNAGKYFKSACIGTATDAAALWTDNGNSGTDTHGFRGLPAGHRRYDGASFSDRGTYTYYWSSSASSSTNALTRGFGYDLATVNHYSNSRSAGFAVRCIRNN
jgi:uncharacterized protein (TIGR02145 family)